ncbi:SDR family NAD(P)-dependent oxidoreductase [Flavobacterium sp. JLP]|uniref:SDR family oxidoreductase n=1 Tax=Flavobacterium sp. JLP TaxID=2783793 RepID=UPI00188ABF92|nr:SDR family NAD(P)-dependent oxidoreductase [Flavobacterium sp. JLP]MBF4508606.1 SDR family NAD(P)-dependent oxidoreductase [Flavobacterium sp. JLP]
MNLSNNKILITGGASGIGLGLTERFLQENNTVIICGRRESVLNEVKTKFPSVITKVCDLSLEEDRIALYKWIQENHPDLNILINNAGIQKWVSVTDADFYESMKAELATNIEAPLHLTSLFIELKSLTTVMNVTSGLAFSPFAKVPVYSATKAFFRSFTISLRHLLKAKKIEVIEIIPPALNTDLGGVGLHDAHPSVSDFIVSIFEQLKEGRTELTFGTSQIRLNASVPELKASFEALHSNL